MKYAVAIDIGGTNTRVALVNENLEITDRQQFPTDSENPGVTLGEIAQVVKGYECTIAGVGMSCPGPLDLIHGQILTPPNLHGDWQHLFVARELSTLTGLPVYLNNDGNLAALAEAVAGEGKDYLSPRRLHECSRGGEILQEGIRLPEPRRHLQCPGQMLRHRYKILR